jgi:hypothetical protein
MDDGESSTVPVTLFYMPPGHDAWIVGNKRCVMIDREKVPSPRFDLSITGMCGTIFYGSMSPFCGLLSARLFAIV